MVVRFSTRGILGIIAGHLGVAFAALVAKVVAAALYQRRTDFTR
jgi:hypothetical protein